MRIVVSPHASFPTSIHSGRRSLGVARKPHTAEKAILQSITSSVREVVMIDYGTLLRDHVTLNSSRDVLAIIYDPV
jgi:hypothetical protein